jgi:hypothetical protein
MEGEGEMRLHDTIGGVLTLICGRPPYKGLLIEYMLFIYLTLPLKALSRR